MSGVLLSPPSTMDEAEFMAAFGGIYEHSPWIAAAAWAARNGDNLDSVDGLHQVMQLAVDNGTHEQKSALICAHPDLAGKAAVAGQLTAESSREQAGAGLDQCSAEEFEAFQSLNTAYREKFGFPFIVAVKGLDRAGILAAFQTRLTHDMETEFHTALDQIHRIARLRLEELAT